MVMKFKLLIAIFTLISTITAITALEIYARARYPKYKYPDQCFLPDPILNHIHKPNQTCEFITPLWNITYSINSLGMRDIDHQAEKDQDIFRILILGDSFTEGYGVKQEDAYPSKLRNILNDPKIEILNGGVASYSPVLEYLYLKEKGLKLNPDLVILALDMTDFLDEKAYFEKTVFDSQNKPIAVETFTPDHQTKYTQNLNPGQKNIKNPFLKYSHFIRLIFKPKPRVIDVKALFKEDEKSWQLTEINLLLIKELLEEQNIKLLLLIYPYQEQLYNDEYLKPIDMITRVANNNDISILNLTDMFKKNDPQKLFIRYDVHFSIAGHNLVANELAIYLKNLLK